MALGMTLPKPKAASAGVAGAKLATKDSAHTALMMVFFIVMFVIVVGQAVPALHLLR